MKLNRRRIVTGIAVTGIAAGALAGGGVAVASASTAPAPAATASAAVSYGPGYGQHDNTQVQAGQQTVLAAAARYLGMTPTGLQTQLQGGKSLADVAQEQGKPVSGLKDAILAAITSRMDANTQLTAEQKEAMLAQVKTNLDTIVNATHPIRADLGPMWAHR